MTTYDPFAPWNTPGWTPFNDIPLVNTPDPLDPPVQEWPESLVITTVTHRYLDPNGYEVKGIVRFTRLVPVETEDTTLAPGQVVGTVDAGDLSVELPVSDDPMYDRPFVYRVQECFPGGRIFNILIPIDGDLTMDLYDLKTDLDDQHLQNYGSVAALEIVIGADFSREFAFEQSPGIPAQGLDGWVGYFAVKDTEGTLITDVDEIPWDAESGSLTVEIDASVTGNLEAGTYVYGLDLYDPESEDVIALVVRSRIRVKESVA